MTVLKAHVVQTIPQFSLATSKNQVWKETSQTLSWPWTREDGDSWNVRESQLHRWLWTGQFPGEEWEAGVDHVKTLSHHMM